MSQQNATQPMLNLTTYAWSGENRLTTVQRSMGSPQTIAMRYNADGLRESFTESGSSITQIWDRQNPLLEMQSPSFMRAFFTNTPNLFGNLVSQRRSGASTFHHFNALGSAIGLTNSSQTLSDVYRYTAFGTALTGRFLRLIAELGGRALWKSARK